MTMDYRCAAAAAAAVICAVQLQVQMEHPEDSEPIGTIVGHVFLAVFQLGTSEHHTAAAASDVEHVLEDAACIYHPEQRQGCLARVIPLKVVAVLLMAHLLEHRVQSAAEVCS